MRAHPSLYNCNILRTPCIVAHHVALTLLPQPQALADSESHRYLLDCRQRRRIRALVLLLHPLEQAVLRQSLLDATLLRFHFPPHDDYQVPPAATCTEQPAIFSVFAFMLTLPSAPRSECYKRRESALQAETFTALLLACRVTQPAVARPTALLLHSFSSWSHGYRRGPTHDVVVVLSLPPFRFTRFLDVPVLTHLVQTGLKTRVRWGQSSNRSAPRACRLCTCNGCLTL